MKAFLGMVMYAQIDRTERMAARHRHDAAALGPRALVRHLMLQEMDEAGVQMGVVPGRISPVLGTIEADDIAAIVPRPPDRLMGYAGSIPSTAARRSRRSTRP